jgi:hypothetical protein
MSEQNMRLTLVVLAAAGCACAAEPSPQARSYLDSAIRIMREKFLHKDKIDWPRLERETLAQAAGAQTPVDTYPAIRFALARLGDHHSFLQLTPELAREERARQPKLADPSAMPATAPARKVSFPYPSPFRARRLAEGAIVPGSSPPLAQVVIPMITAQGAVEMNGHATRIQAVLAELAARHPCGWIVDLRGNGGGNLWPMMAGIGPLLGEGEPGAQLHPDGAKSKWYYEAGKSGHRDDTVDPFYARTNAEPVKLVAAPPVAVLIDRDTGSSGEGMAIAFRGRPATRFFGELTYGAATSTFPFPLADGAQIYLVTGTMVDRNGIEYPNGVAPDEEVLSLTTLAGNDPVIRAASAWLSKQDACRPR